jgi:antitoxin CptB
MSAPEPRAHRLKRMRMRAMRRGMKEMDLILGNYAAEALSGMDESGLALFDAVLEEADQDLYQWITGQRPAPDPLAALIAAIAAHAGMS